jgi:hypothetical protein
MELPELVPIEYRGNLVALVSARRVHIVAPWLRTRPAGDPELRFVAYMCLCCGEVLRGGLPGPYTDELGEEWATHAMAGEPRDAATSMSALDRAEADADRDAPGPHHRNGRPPHGGQRE